MEPFEAIVARKKSEHEDRVMADTAFLYGHGWNEALEVAATIAEGYPERFGDEYVAHDLIRAGQDNAAADIAAEIRKYKNVQS